MDVFGKALINYYKHQSESTLWLHNSYGKVEEMPVDVFFRGIGEMPDLELIALSQCSGKILDIGAGVGSHALILQEKGMDVTALEISATACQIMKLRGVKKILNQDIFTYRDEKFDTLLMLMNGIGLSESISGLRYFLRHVKTLLNPGGKLIFDSSDISYLYFGETFPTDKYYGQISYQYEYAGEKGDWFNWLYIDKQLLKEIATEEGWKLELIYEDDMDQFLVKLSIVND